MSKIWIFGDSYSTPFSRGDYWQEGYLKWKGYTPEVFGDILKREYGMPIEWLSDGGICNDSIFQRIYTNANRIQKGDILIIGWTSIQRFRLSLEVDMWWNITGNSGNKWLSNEVYPDISQRTIDEILINREGRMWVKEFEDRVRFVDWLFGGNRVINWSPFNGVLEDKIIPKFQTIREETGGEVNDGHMSEGGHKEIAKGMIELLNNPSQLKEFNNLNKRII